MPIVLGGAPPSKALSRCSASFGSSPEPVHARTQHVVHVLQAAPAGRIWMRSSELLTAPPACRDVGGRGRRGCLRGRALSRSSTSCPAVDTCVFIARRRRPRAPCRGENMSVVNPADRPSCSSTGIARRTCLRCIFPSVPSALSGVRPVNWHSHAGPAGAAPCRHRSLLHEHAPRRVGVARLNDGSSLLTASPRPLPRPRASRGERRDRLRIDAIITSSASTGSPFELRTPKPPARRPCRPGRSPARLPGCPAPSARSR